MLPSLGVNMWIAAYAVAWFCFLGALCSRGVCVSQSGLLDVEVGWGKHSSSGCCGKKDYDVRSKSVLTMTGNTL